MSVRRSLRFVTTALVAAAVATACTETPSEPVPADGETQVDALLPEVALPATDGSSAAYDVQGHLERLLRQALLAVAEREGRAAVEPITARLRQLHDEARRAREAGDEDAFRAAAEAAHLEAAGIVIHVLGTYPLERLQTFVNRRIREITVALGDRAAPDLRGILDRARRLLQRSRATDRADHALVAVAGAADLLSRLDRPADEPGTLFTLLGHALNRISMEHGAAAARAVHGDIQALADAVARARRTGNAEAYRRAVNEMEDAAAQVVLRVLGPEVLERVLRSGADGLVALERRIHRLQGTDVDLAPLRRRLAAATELHGAATRAARQGRPVEALRAGARALDVLGGLGD